MRRKVLSLSNRKGQELGCQVGGDGKGWCVCVAGVAQSMADVSSLMLRGLGGGGG